MTCSLYYRFLLTLKFTAMQIHLKDGTVINATSLGVTPKWVTYSDEIGVPRAICTDKVERIGGMVLNKAPKVNRWKRFWRQIFLRLQNLDISLR